MIGQPFNLLCEPSPEMWDASQTLPSGYLLEDESGSRILDEAGRQIATDRGRPTADQTGIKVSTRKRRVNSL